MSGLNLLFKKNDIETVASIDIRPRFQPAPNQEIVFEYLRCIDDKILAIAKSILLLNPHPKR